MIRAEQKFQKNGQRGRAETLLSLGEARDHFSMYVFLCPFSCLNVSVLFCVSSLPCFYLFENICHWLNLLKNFKLIRRSRAWPKNKQVGPRFFWSFRSPGLDLPLSFFLCCFWLFFSSFQCFFNLFFILPHHTSITSLSCFHFCFSIDAHLSSSDLCIFLLSLLILFLDIFPFYHFSHLLFPRMGDSRSNTCSDVSVSRFRPPVFSPFFFLFLLSKVWHLFWSRLKACGMCMQCISVHDDQPTQGLLLKAKLMQRALRNLLMTENGTEKLDNELITTLFENITTLAQTTPVHACRRKKQQRTSHISRRKRHTTQQVTVFRFPPAIRTLDCFPDVFACNVITLDQCWILIVRRRNNQTEQKRDVHGWNTQLNSTRPLSHASTLSNFQLGTRLWSRGHQLFV